MRHLKPVFVTTVVATTLALATYHELHGHAPASRFLTSPATVGDIVRVVEADGTLGPVSTVKVGTQVSGTIRELDADFNNIVHRGQILARLDPALINAEVEQARARLAQSTADVDQAQVAFDDAKVKLQQGQALARRQVIPPSDLEDARLAFDTAQADLQSRKAQLKQAQAALDQSLVDLGNTVITSPIDGIVVARDVDPGQTVASSYESPTLFEVAADLTRMQLIASIDEADIAGVKPGQAVQFAVDAYPNQEFTGVVAQVRLQPDTDQGAVEYSTVVSVANPDLELKPGMTGRLRIEVARHERVLRVPSAALQFVPAREDFTALRQPVPSGLAEMAAARTRRKDASTGVVWVWDGRLRAERVKLGLSDGTFTEVAGATLRAGSPVATMVVDR